MSINPFLQLNTITNMNLFYGREKILLELAEHIHAGQSCSIIGEHKTGKSSILYLIGQDQKWEHVSLDHAVFKFVYYDFQSDPQADKNSFWKTILQELGNQISNNDISDEIRGLCLKPDVVASSVKSLFRRIGKIGLKLVLLLDEFDLISQNVEQFGFYFLSSLRSLVNEDFVIITATRRSLKDIFPWEGGTSPFYNVFKEIYLGQLSLLDAQKLILQAKNPSRPTLKNEKDFVLEKAGRHPYVVQRLCYHIYDKKRESRKLDAAALNDAVRLTYDDTVPFFENIWLGLDPVSKQILASLVDNEVHLEFSGDEVRKLIKTGLVDLIDGRIFLFSDIFLQFVQRHKMMSVPSRPHLSTDLKSAQEHLNRKLRYSEFDVFLCHNSLDKSKVTRVGTELKRLGILPWLDEWNLRPGFPWQKELENTIDKIHSVAVFIGKDGIGPWQEDEIMAFLRQFHKRSCPVMPVILPSCGEVPKLPVFLEGMGWVDFRKKDPNPLIQLIWGITGQKSHDFAPWLSRLLHEFPVQELINDLEMS